jgi:hypothetical protein
MVTALFCQWFLLSLRGRLMILQAKMFHLTAAGRHPSPDEALLLLTVRLRIGAHSWHGSCKIWRDDRLPFTNLRQP